MLPSALPTEEEFRAIFVALPMTLKVEALRQILALRFIKLAPLSPAQSELVERVLSHL